MPFYVTGKKNCPGPESDQGPKSVHVPHLPRPKSVHVPHLARYKSSLDPESNRGPTDYLDTLQSAALPTELSREE